MRNVYNDVFIFNTVVLAFKTQETYFCQMLNLVIFM